MGQPPFVNQRAQKEELQRRIDAGFVASVVLTEFLNLGLLGRLKWLLTGK